MLGKLLSPFTTATAGGIAFRDFFIALGSLIAAASSLGWLSDAQAAYLKQVLDAILGNWAPLTLVVGTLMYGGMTIYRSALFAMSNKAAEVAKQVDAKVAPSAPVVINTPPGVPDIVVAGTGTPPSTSARGPG